MKTTEATDSKTVYSYSRWSCVAQTQGDSERRQIEQAQDWAARRGLKLSDRTFADKGVSAKAGKNLTDGALGDLVKVAKSGDVLLIEDNDRFSRQSPITALASLSAVVNKGISVVFMRTGVEVNRDNFNDMSVIVPNFFGALLANQENEKKAFRVRESWVKRRELLRNGQVCGQRLPSWLEVVGKPARNQPRDVRPVAQKVAIVMRIFALAVGGYASRRIADQLNNEQVPLITGQSRNRHGQTVTKWNGECIRLLLRNPAVLGHYRVLDGKRLTGEVMENIFPAIIDQKTFDAVQSKPDVNRKQTTRSVSTCLVTGLVKCGCCGGNMQHKTNRHSKTHHVYKYLVCSQSKVGASNNPACSKRTNYPAFEAALLALLSQSAAVKNSLGQASSEPSKLAELRGRLAAADKQAEQLWQWAQDKGDMAQKTMDRIETLDRQAEQLRAELQSEERKAAATTSPQLAYESVLGQLVEVQKSDESRERFKLALRDIIDRIDLIDYGFRVTFKGGKAVTVGMGRNPEPIDLANVAFVGPALAMP